MLREHTESVPLAFSDLLMENFHFTSESNDAYLRAYRT